MGKTKCIETYLKNSYDMPVALIYQNRKSIASDKRSLRLDRKKNNNNNI